MHDEPEAFWRVHALELAQKIAPLWEHNTSGPGSDDDVQLVRTTVELIDRCAERMDALLKSGLDNQEPRREAFRAILGALTLTGHRLLTKPNDPDLLLFYRGVVALSARLSEVVATILAMDVPGSHIVQ